MLRSKTNNAALWVAIVTVAVFTAAAQAQEPDGLWEFDSAANLGLATIGTDLAPTGTGFTAISGTGAGDGAVTVDVGSYYTMTHGIAPNGGGSKVNQWTLLIDFRVPSLGQWYCFFQTDATNTSDGEYFISNSDYDIGVGALGYSADEGMSGFTVTAGTWYRMVFSVDIDDAVTHLAGYNTYIDGVEIAGVGGYPAIMMLDDRHSPDPTLLLFADENSEDNPIDVANVAVWDRALSDEEALALGAAGDPIPPAAEGEGEGEGEGEPAYLGEPEPYDVGLFVAGDAFNTVPAGSVIVEVGQTARVHVPAGAAPYQWFKDDAPSTPLTDGPTGSGSILSGTATDTLVIANVQFEDAGSYQASWADKGETGWFFVGVVGAGSMPVAGLVGLGMLAGACVLGGAAILRRRK